MFNFLSRSPLSNKYFNAHLTVLRAKEDSSEISSGDFQVVVDSTDNTFS